MLPQKATVSIAVTSELQQKRSVVTAVRQMEYSAIASQSVSSCHASAFWPQGILLTRQKETEKSTLNTRNQTNIRSRYLPENGLLWRQSDGSISRTPTRWQKEVINDTIAR
jgi:hypothetical protein